MPQFPEGHKWVYEEHILLKSWLALRRRSELRIPQDIRADIETVYDDAAVSPADPALKSLWESTAENLKKTKEKHLREANDRYLPSPWAGQRLDKLTEMGREEEDELHPFFQALTRLAARTVTAVCLFRLGEKLFYDKDHMRRVSLNLLPDKDGVAAILRRSCSIGDRRVLDSVESIPVPALWRKNALLRNCHPIDFDELGRHNFGKYSLVLSAETGLRVEKSPNAGI